MVRQYDYCIQEQNMHLSDPAYLTNLRTEDMKYTPINHNEQTKDEKYFKWTTKQDKDGNQFICLPV